jgi:multicomponent Na+:H+ antiporter subunit E
MTKKVSAFVILLVFWVLLAWPFSPAPPPRTGLMVDWGMLGVGVLLVALVAVLTSGKYPHREWLLNPARLFWLLLYVPYFLYYCVKANLDVAYRVVHPDMPIHPGIVKVRTKLKTKLAKTFLANSITLTPGTLTVDIAGEDLYVHWINVDTEDPRERTDEIVGRFEGFLTRIFE